MSCYFQTQCCRRLMLPLILLRIKNHHFIALSENLFYLLSFPFVTFKLNAAGNWCYGVTYHSSTYMNSQFIALSEYISVLFFSFFAFFLNCIPPTIFPAHMWMDMKVSSQLRLLTSSVYCIYTRTSHVCNGAFAGHPVTNAKSRSGLTMTGVTPPAIAAMALMQANFPFEEARCQLYDLLLPCCFKK